MPARRFARPDAGEEKQPRRRKGARVGRVDREGRGAVAVVFTLASSVVLSEEPRVCTCFRRSRQDADGEASHATRSAPPPPRTSRE